MLTDVAPATPPPPTIRTTPKPSNPTPRFPSSPRTFATVLPKAKLAAVVALDEVLNAGARRRPTARQQRRRNATPHLPTPARIAGGVQSDMKLAYATEGTISDPYAGFETRVVPENVTLAAEDQGPDHRRQSVLAERIPRRQEG